MIDQTHSVVATDKAKVTYIKLFIKVVDRQLMLGALLRLIVNIRHSPITLHRINITGHHLSVYGPSTIARQPMPINTMHDGITFLMTYHSAQVTYRLPAFANLLIQQAGDPKIAATAACPRDLAASPALSPFSSLTPGSAPCLASASTASI